MAERASMAAQIDLVERLVGDTANDRFTRDAIAASLDVYRVEARYEPLTGMTTYAPGGAAVVVTFAADAGYWETDAALFDGTYTPLTPAAADWTAGRWTFAAEPTLPVYLLGWNHDPYLAAADLLEVRATQVSEDYDFQTGPDSFKRSQRQGQLLKMAARYREMSPRLKAVEDAASDWTMPEISVDVFSF